MSDIQLLALSRMMAAELDRGDEIYRPSAFWRELNEKHENNIILDGFRHFKIRTNEQYFTFISQSLSSPNMKKQIELWPSHLDDTVIDSVFENRDVFQEPHLAEIYRIYVSLLWGLMKHHDTLGLFERLSEPLVGNPMRIKSKDRYISQDICNSYREFHGIVRGAYDGSLPAGSVIGELGSGYGRVGYVFGMLTDARYCFFDIPPALAIAQTYFREVFPDRKIFGFRHFDDFRQIEAELGSSQFAFFTANQIALFPDSYFDSFVNISSLHEMQRRQIDHYLGQIDRLTRHSIYLKQWLVSHNPQDGITVTKDDYPLPGHWQVAIDREDLAVDGFFERLLIRRPA